MAARNKPAGIRSLVYGIGKGKAGIEGFRRVAAHTRPKTRAFLAASSGSDKKVRVLQIHALGQQT